MKKTIADVRIQIILYTAYKMFDACVIKTYWNARKQKIKSWYKSAAQIN